jgi:hypothetical protein
VTSPSRRASRGMLRMLYRMHGNDWRPVANAGVGWSPRGMRRVLSEEFGFSFEHLRRGENYPQIEQLHAEGKCDKEIAQTLALEHAQVSKIRRRLGLEPNPTPPSFRAKRKYKGVRLYDWDEIVDLRVSLGLDPGAISNRTGMSTDYVYRVLIQSGLRAGTPNSSRPPLADRLKVADRMINEEGASFAEVMRTVKISRHTLKKHFPGKQWTTEQVLQHARTVRHGERAIDLAFPAAGKTPRLTHPVGG